MDEDHLVFGSETSGINETFLKKNWKNTCTIPMNNPHIRSLNLATSVGIVLYEAIRQVDAI
jgi:tRNA (cytidine/uridine-2'-O-)-methyltransferase